jgi:hypothetical protein
VARSDRTDAAAPEAAEASGSLPAVTNGDTESDRALPPGSSDGAVPALFDDEADDGGPPALGAGDTATVDEAVGELPAAPDPGEADEAPAVTSSAPEALEAASATHELLEAREEPPPTRKGAEPQQLVSGDPLLRGPAPASSPAPPPPPQRPDAAAPRPAPPSPPPRSATAEAPPASPPGGASPAAAAVVGGIGVASATQPARRASRGAHVTERPTAGPPSSPPQQPVATLRPTTVAPVPRMVGRRPRVRRVTRVVRHVDPWSVFKVAAVFSVVAYAIALVAGVLLWNVAYATGTIDNIERGMESTGWEVFELDGAEIFRNAWIGGLFAAVGLTGLAVLVATLFNLITDLVGGIRLTVLEEEVIEKTASPMRRFATAPGPAPSAQAQPSPAPPQGAEARLRRARGG